MNHRVLTKEQVNEAKYLRAKMGFTKRKLAKYFKDQNIEVGETTIWWNICATQPRPKQVNYYKQNNLPRPKKNICIPCGGCEICMTKEFEDQRIPLNYQIGDKCIDCYMRSIGLGYKDLI
jgi:hypothetical protein